MRLRKSSTLFLVFSMCFVCNLFSQNRPQPVIDMHLHAEHIKKQGALYIGAPFPGFGSYDPKKSYDSAFQTIHSSNQRTDHFLASPGTNDSLRQLTIAALKKNNVYGITSGDIETVRKWKSEAPGRII